MPQLILQPGPTEGVDTYIHDQYPMINWSSLHAIGVGKNEYRGSYYTQRGLLRFDISSILTPPSFNPF